MKKRNSGLSLIELMMAITIFSMVASFATMFFVSGQRYYQSSQLEIDLHDQARKAIWMLLEDIQETSVIGVRINATHDAILMVSPRTTGGNFAFYAGPSRPFLGSPHWQKWVVYYKAESGDRLVRKEGNPFGTPFPSPALSILVASIPSDWETVFRNASLPSKVVDYVSGIEIQDDACQVTGNPLYIQLRFTGNFGGKEVAYNPGSSVSFPCGKTGNWAAVELRN